MTNLHKYIGCLLFLVYIFPCSTTAQQTDTLIVNFDFNSSAISQKAASMLDQYFSAGRQLFTVQHVQISGHCDSTGLSFYNTQLSLARAASVKKYLCSKWMGASQISSMRGLGKKFPLNNNQTTEQRAANRRVEIILQKKEIAGNANLHVQKIVPFINENALYNKIMDTATRVGSIIVLRQINFYAGSHSPLPESIPAIDELVAAMQARQQLKIEIDGYVCCNDDSQDGIDQGTGNRDLSTQRAKFVYNFLVSKGITPERMTYKGFGASHKLYPLERNAAEERSNRRVEIKIISK